MFLELQINILILSGRIMTLKTRIMSAENSVTGINYILKYIKIEKKYLNILKHLNIVNISFCFNYCLNSAWHGGDQFVALLRWYGSPGFFDSGLQLT